MNPNLIVLGIIDFVIIPLTDILKKHNMERPQMNQGDESPVPPHIHSHPSVCDFVGSRATQQLALLQCLPLQKASRGVGVEALW